MSATEPKDKSNSKQEIRNPRRLLILSPSSHAHSIIPALLKTLTGHAPDETQIQTQSFAGYTTHPPLRIENRYYTAEVPVWVDEIAAIAEGDKSATTKQESEESGEESKPKPKPGEGEDKEEAAGSSALDQELGASAASAGEEDPSAQWSREFSGSEARVVRDAIGAVMICIRNPGPVPSPVPGSTETEAAIEDSEGVRALKAFVSAVGGVRALIEEERGEIGSVPGLLVLGGKQKNEKHGGKQVKGADEDVNELDGSFDEPFSIGWWEDQLCEMGLIGFEVVKWDGTPIEQEGEERNEYGELQGMRRVKEVLETHEWAGDEEPDTDLPDDVDDLERELLSMDERDSGFNKEVNELEREMVGLRFAIGRGGRDAGDSDDGWDDDEREGDEELRVESVEALLTRMRAIKDMSDELPEQDRKRFAAKAVRDIMKEI